MQGRLAIAASIALGAALVGLGVLALGFVARDLAAGGGGGRAPARLPNPDLRLLSDPDYDQRLARDSIRPIYEPQFIPAAEASLLDDEVVMGLVINGDARAYPVTTLNRREMVNDTVGGTPVLVTW